MPPSLPGVGRSGTQASRSRANWGCNSIYHHPEGRQVGLCTSPPYLCVGVGDVPKLRVSECLGPEANAVPCVGEFDIRSQRLRPGLPGPLRSSSVPCQPAFSCLGGLLCAEDDLTLATARLRAKLPAATNNDGSSPALGLKLQAWTVFRPHVHAAHCPHRSLRRLPGCRLKLLQ